MFLGLPARPVDDVRTLLFPALHDSHVRALLACCPGISQKGSPTGEALLPKSTPPEGRHLWPGKNLLLQRHQIVLEDLSSDDISARIAATKNLSVSLGVSPLLASVLISRDLGHVGSAREYLTPSIDKELSKLPIYTQLHHAASLIRAACQEHLRIVVVSDYDADGNCSAAIIRHTIDLLGWHCTVIQPDRVKDGYGLKDSTLARVQRHLPHLVITLDLGTSNRSQIEALKRTGTTTIVVDHHELPGDKTAAPDVFVNPKSHPSLRGYQDLCASGLAFLIAREALALEYSKNDLPTLYHELLPYAAIGTVADIMTLTALNRAIVFEGNKAIPTCRRPAIRAITAYRKEADITGEFIGYQIGPFFNAPGRIEEATGDTPGTAVVLEFLTTPYDARAVELLNHITGVNDRRKELEAEGLQHARELIKMYQHRGEKVHCGVALPIETAHEGVVGLIAARVCEAMQVPVLAFARDAHGDWKGSGRSIPGVSLIQLLRTPDLSPLIEEFGGHDAAAGLRVSAKNMELFRQRFSYLCQEVFQLPEVINDPFTRHCQRPAEFPKVDRWLKEYRPDLIMTVDDVVRNAQELSTVCSALEPCSRGNPPLKILLPQVKILSKRETAGGHIRLTLEDRLVGGGDWRAAQRLEAIVFARSVSHRLIHDIKEGELLDIIIQPAFDKAKVMEKGRESLNVQIILAQPTSFLFDEIQAAPQSTPPPRPAAPTQTKNADVVTLFNRKTVPPTFTSIGEFYKHFGITCLTEAVKFRGPQITFVARELSLDIASPGENLLYRVNTSGGKTVIAFMKAAHVLSHNPNAKVLYLTPQTDLVHQAIGQARLMFGFPSEQIVEVTGEVPATRRIASYAGPGKVFIGTPHTIKNDGDISHFSLVILDEIHFMRGDQPEREDTRYAYRWVVEEVKRLQGLDKPITLWAQSGTPASTRDELRALIATLNARYSKAKLPTGVHEWSVSRIELSDSYRESLSGLRGAYRNAYRELKEGLPPWVRDPTTESPLSAARLALRRAYRGLVDAHGMQDHTFPSRSETLRLRAELLTATNKVEAELKANKSSTDWLWTLRSRINELEAIHRLFESLRSKGRTAFAYDLVKIALDVIYPTNKSEPRPFSHHLARLLRRHELEKVLTWALQEGTSMELLSEFRRLYPGPHSTGSTNEKVRKVASTRKAWQKLCGTTEATLGDETADTLEAGEKKTDLHLRFGEKLLPEFIASSTVDLKEAATIRILRSLPTGAKTMILCEKKFEARLLSERLKKAGFLAGWYAGKSVSKKVGLHKNLEDFREGKLRALCCTSVGDTGHDIAEVTHIIRITPLTSPTRNAQSRGRAGRQEGLTGAYVTLCVWDEDKDFNEMPKFYRGRTRLWAMERI